MKNSWVQQTIVAVIIALGVVAIFSSSQDWDVRHTAHMGAGILSHGLSYYTQNEAFAEANYLPSTYILTQLAFFPAAAVQFFLGANKCSLLNAIPCYWEMLFVKLWAVILALLWLRMVAPRPKFLTIALLASPTVFYAWAFFGAYDPIGAFATLIGGTLFF